MPAKLRLTFCSRRRPLGAAVAALFFATVLLALGAPAKAQVDPQAIANKAIVMEIVNQIINQRQVDIADALVGDNMVQHLNRPTQGLAAYKAHYQKLFKRFKDYTLDVSHVIADADNVAVHGRLHGITKGGNKINFHVVDIYRLENGKLAERWHVEQIINQ